MITANEARDIVKIIEQDNSSILDDISSRIKHACKKGDRKITLNTDDMDEKIRKNILDILKESGYNVINEAVDRPFGLECFYIIKW